MIDFLHAVGWIVPGPRAAASCFADVFGLGVVRDDWVQRLPEHGYEAVFMRTSDSLATAPTRIEMIGSVTPASACSLAPIEVLEHMQRRRPQMTHATVMCVPDLDEQLDLFARRGVPVRVEPGCAHLAHRRVWIGWSPDGALHFPGLDGGLLLEMIPTEALGRKVVASVTTEATDLSRTTRVARRVHLVADLDAVVRSLAAHVDLEPDGDLHIDGVLGARTATYRFRHGAGADLVVAEPWGEGDAAAYFRCWGAGPWLTTLHVVDAGATADRAREAGAGLSRLADSEMGAVIVEHPQLPGMLVELVDGGSTPLRATAAARHE